MSQLRGVHFAAHDPSAGLLDFWRMNSCASSVRRPRAAKLGLEAVVVAWIWSSAFAPVTRVDRALARYHPGGANQALHLYESSAHSSWVADAATAESIYDQVVSLFHGRDEGI